MLINNYKKKILHIVVGFDKGGIESILFKLISHESSNFEHVIISFNQPGYYGEIALKNGFKLYSLNNKKGKLSFKSLFKLYNHIVNERPEIVQTWWYPADLIGGLIARLAGVKNIVWGVFSSNFDKKVIGKGTMLFAPICALASRIIPNIIISCAESSINSHIKYGYTTSKWRFIPPGVALQNFLPNSDYDRRCFNNFLVGTDTAIFGCLARWDPLKDHKNLFEALCRLKQHKLNTICFLAGPGMNSSNTSLIELLDYFELTQDDVILLGDIVSVSDFFKFIDVHILSSLGEGFPNVILEAMSFSVPCISTDVGDLKSVISNTGWVVPVSNAEALKGAIFDAISEMQNLKLWNQRRTNCRNRVAQKYTIDKMVAEYSNVWNEVIS